MAKSNEPIFWSLFSAGGMMAALFLPILMAITGILIPFGIVPSDVLGYDRVHAAVSGNLIVKAILLALISLPLFHWAHRFKFVLADIGLHSIERLLGVLCYGSAIVGTALAGFVLWGV